MPTATKTDPAFDEVGIAAEPLDDKGAAAIKLLCDTLYEMDLDQFTDRHQNPHLQRLESACRLLWGQDGLNKVTGGDKGDDNDGMPHVPPGDDTEVADAPYAGIGMSLDKRLRRCVKLGQATPAEYSQYAKLSLDQPKAVEGFLAAREPLPAGTMTGGMSPTAVKDVAEWAMGGRRK